MRFPFNLRFVAACASLAPFCALLLPGCGGGSGGGPSAPRPTPIPGTTPTPRPTATPTPRTVFFDDFSGSSLNGGNWGTYTANQELQRTRFGRTPQLLDESGTSFARLAIDTYNPNSPGTFHGTEIFTRNRFERGNGLEIEARLRGPITQPGIVFAFFTIYDRYDGAVNINNYRKTEIDFEFLTAEQEQFSPAGQRRRLYLNIWDDWNEPRDGFDGDDVETPSRRRDDKTYGLSTQNDFDWGNWNTYTIRWFPDRTEFLLNGVVQRTEREVLPDEAMSVHFNIWSGIPAFAQAYSPNFAAVTNAAQNRSFAFDVDFVRVRELGASGTRARSFLRYEIPPGPSQRNR